MLHFLLRDSYELIGVRCDDDCRKRRCCDVMFFTNPGIYKNNAFLTFDKEDPLLRKVLKTSPKAWKPYKWGCNGVLLLTELLETDDFKVTVLP